MPKEYEVKITEILSRTVTVEADTLEEAQDIVKKDWQNGIYVLDADDFADVSFESNEPYIELTYREMTDVFSHINKTGKDAICGYVVFSQNTFDKDYSETSRTYVISSNNKAFIPDAGGYSIYASCLDGTDQNIRLEGYMRGEKAWKIERCYMLKEDYQNAVSQPVLNERQPESR